jgi:dolichol-phosphate mannosyltransferase
MLDKKNNIETSNIELSVVVPVFNEVDNVEPLILEIQATLENIIPYEMIFIDDCSSDGTLNKLVQLKSEIENLRVLTHNLRSGQSAAVRSGVKAARAILAVTLDGDGQNNPSDILNLLAAYEEYVGKTKNIMICGQRAKRKDSFIKRFSSKIANAICSSLLGDLTMDSGCGLKLFRVMDFMDLPSFDHMHRFLPALMIRSGGEVLPIKVSHRSRERGKSKYGVFDRLWVGIFDLFGMVWLRCRPINPEVKEPE